MARSFTSTSHYLQMSRKWADLDWFGGSASGSVHLWVKVNSLANDLTIMAQYGGGGNGGYLMRTSGASPNTKLELFYGGADLSGKQAITSGVFTAGVWTPVTATWNASTNTMTSYINGGNSGTVTAAPSTPVASVWSLGARQGATNAFNGDIGEVCMWPGVVLTAGQVAALAKGVPAHLVEPRSLRHWKIHGNGTEYESGAQLRGGRAWGVVGSPGKSSSQPPVGETRGGQQLWVTDISEDGSSIANFTADSGSWAVSSGVIRCSGAGAGGRLRHNTTVTSSWLREVECEMRISSTSVADQSRGGLLNWWDGAGTGDPHARLMWRTAAAERAEVERDATAGIAGVDFAFSLDTWYKLTFQGTKWYHDFFVDDVFQVGGGDVAGFSFGTKMGLLALNAIVDFRNIRSRSLSPA